MNKIVILCASIFLLSGCASAPPTYITKYQVVIAPNSMYNCPVIGKLPKIETLTELQFAKITANLAENNKVCKTSLDKLKAYYQEAKSRIEGKN